MSFFMVIFWRIVGARNLKARLCVFRMDLNEFGKISGRIYDYCGSLEWNECCRYFVLFFFSFFFFDGKIFVSFLSSDLISFFLFSSNKFDGCARYG